MSKTIPPVLALIILLPRNLSTGAHEYTTKQAVTCTQCYQGKLRSVCTNPISLHALKCSSPRSTSYILLPCCIRSPHLIPLQIPSGEPRTRTSLAHGPREWCRVSNKLKWTFLRNHFPNRQKCSSPAHPYRKCRWEVERVLNLITMLSGISPLHHTMVLLTSKPCGQQKFTHTTGNTWILWPLMS